MRLNAHIINDYIFTFLGAPIMALFSFAYTLDQSNIPCSHPLDKVMEYTFCSSLAKFFDSSYEHFTIRLLNILQSIFWKVSRSSALWENWNLVHLKNWSLVNGRTKNSTIFSELMKNCHYHPEVLPFFPNFSRDSWSQFAV